MTEIDPGDGARSRWSKPWLGLLLGVTGLVAGSEGAAGQVMGPEILLGDQNALGISPSVVALADGAFLVAWSTHDGDATGVVHQRFDAQGAPLGPAVPTNSYVLGTQFQAALAPSFGADSFAAWTTSSRHLPDPSTQVAVRSLGSDGTPLQAADSELAATSSQVTDVAVARELGGDALLVLVGGGEVYSRRVDVQTLAASPGIGLTDLAETVGDHVAVARGLDGRALAVWASAGGPRGRFLDALGAPLAPSFRIADGDNVFDPAVAAGPDGSYLVLWSEVDLQGQQRLYGRRVNAEGVFSGAAFEISQLPLHQGYVPAAAIAPDGSFLVVWASADEVIFSDSLRGEAKGGNLPDGIFGRLFLADATPWTDPFMISSPQILPNQVEVAVNGAGEYLVTWSGNHQNWPYKAFARGVTPTGAPIAVPALSGPGLAAVALLLAGSGLLLLRRGRPAHLGPKRP